MTAKEKFEARARELGISPEQIYQSECVGVETDDFIVILVFYDDEESSYWELRYPRFKAMDANDRYLLVDHFGKEWYHRDSKEESDFFRKLALWSVNSSNDCPLFPADCYQNIDPVWEGEFTDDPKTAEDNEEDEYQKQREDNATKIKLMQDFMKLYRKSLCDMIRQELARGHQIPLNFDPYPGWGSHHLCGYDLDGKDMRITISADDEVELRLYDSGGNADHLWPRCPDFPIEVLIRIYEEMK